MTTIDQARLETLAKHGNEMDTRTLAGELLTARRLLREQAEVIARRSADEPDPGYRVVDTKTGERITADEVLDEVNNTLRRCHSILTTLGVPFAEWGHEIALGTRLQMLKDKLSPRQHGDPNSWELVGFDDKRSGKMIDQAHKVLDDLDVPRQSEQGGIMAEEYTLAGRLKLLVREEDRRFNGRPRKLDWSMVEEAVVGRLQEMDMAGERDLVIAETVAKHVIALIRGRIEPAFDALVKLRLGDEMDFDMSKRPYYEKGDEKAPFFSEAFTYVLLGKEAARTLRGRLRKVAEAAGLNTDRW